MRHDRLMLRFARLGWRRHSLLVEALAAIMIASLAIRLLPFERAVRLGSRRLARHPRRHSPEICREVRWSVTTVAARVPWRALCFQKGLALQWILRRRGIDARLHYGIGFDPSDQLSAHVWIVVDQAIIIGGEEAPAVSCLAVYPS